LKPPHFPGQQYANEQNHRDAYPESQCPHHAAGFRRAFGVSSHHEEKCGGEGSQYAQKCDSYQYVHGADYPVNSRLTLGLSKQSPLRPYLVFLAAMSMALLTARLGLWQLSRANEKLALLQSIQTQSALPALQAQELKDQPLLWQQVNRTVALQGRWLSDKTIYLDNRVHHGQSGFWVMTPLRWSTGQVVWVQRGWVARDPVDATKAAPVQTADAVVNITARIAGGLSHMVELKKTDTQVSDGAGIHIQANLALPQMQALVEDKVNAVVMQTGADTDGLRRDWVIVGVDPDKNTAYAFQWFGISALVTLLYVWFQWIGPLLHARKQSRST